MEEVGLSSKETSVERETGGNPYKGVMQGVRMRDWEQA